MASLRPRVLIGLLGAVVGLAAVAAVIVPRAGEVCDALDRVGIGTFLLVVLLGVLSMIFRTAAWQIAIDAAGGRVRAREAHPASAAAFLVALLSPYLGVAMRISVIRNRAPDRSPTVSQQIAAESALVIVEGALAACLVLLAAWSLGIPFLAAVGIFLAGIVAATLLVIAARRFAPRRFGAGLALARQPHTLGLVVAALAATMLVQITRTAVALSSVGLDAPPLVVLAVFLAGGVGVVIPVGTATTGAAAPLLAAPTTDAGVADATAAGVLLSGGLMLSCVGYLLVSSLAAALVRSSAKPRSGEAA